MKPCHHVLVVSLALVVPACTSSTDHTADDDTDAGRVYAPSDAGTATPMDGVDAGPLGNPDAGPASTESCGEVPTLPDELLPRCSAETQYCLEACPEMDGDCRFACIEADTHPIGGDEPGCLQCVVLSMLHCLETHECAEPVATALCCDRENCGPGSAPDCRDTECGAESEALATCAAIFAPECSLWVGSEFDGCFAGEVTE